jgi:DNA polymerase-3 subunit beta
MTDTIADVRQSDIEDVTGRPASAVLTINNKDLAPMMARATGAALRGSTIPILECALLGVANGIFTIETTNMELAIRQQLAMPTSAKWKAAINVELLAGVSRQLSSDAKITLEPGDQCVVLRSGRTRMSFRTLAVEDFPQFQDSGYVSEFEMDASALLRLLSRAAPFISNDASRYYLSGVHLSAQKQQLRAAATNGNQLASVYSALPAGAETVPEIIVPRQAIGEIMKLLNGVSAEVRIAVAHSRIKVATDGIILVSKLVDGTFPDIDRVIPQSNPNVLRVDTKAFIRSLNLVSLLTERKGLKTVKLDITPGSLMISARDPEAGDASETLEADDMEYDGDRLEIAFQPKFLIDVAKLCGDSTEFRFSDILSPFRVDDDNAIYVAMGARW